MGSTRFLGSPPWDPFPRGAATSTPVPPSPSPGHRAQTHPCRPPPSAFTESGRRTASSVHEEARPWPCNGGRLLSLLGSVPVSHARIVSPPKEASPSVSPSSLSSASSSPASSAGSALGGSPPPQVSTPQRPAQAGARAASTPPTSTLSASRAPHAQGQGPLPSPFQRSSPAASQPPRPHPHPHPGIATGLLTQQALRGVAPGLSCGAQRC